MCVVVVSILCATSASSAPSAVNYCQGVFTAEDAEDAGVGKKNLKDLPSTIRVGG